MAFRVQLQRFEEHDSYKYGLYEIEERGGALVWKQLCDATGTLVSPDPYPDMPPPIPKVIAPGGRCVTDDEAELLTGLSAPVCFDKIMDLM